MFERSPFIHSGCRRVGVFAQTEIAQTAAESGEKILDLGARDVQVDFVTEKLRTGAPAADYDFEAQFFQPDSQEPLAIDYTISEYASTFVLIELSPPTDEAGVILRWTVKMREVAA